MQPIRSTNAVEEFILEHENKNTAQKTERDVRLLERFLKTKDKDRKVEDIPAAELNEFISEFIISVSTKDGNEYENWKVTLMITEYWLSLHDTKQFVGMASFIIILIDIELD